MYNFANREELENFLSAELINTAEASHLLNCSRQYIYKLVKEGKLKPFKSLEKERLFWKSDILARVKPSE